jgi:hypothetical protein
LPLLFCWFSPLIDAKNQSNFNTVDSSIRGLTANGAAGTRFPPPATRLFALVGAFGLMFDGVAPSPSPVAQWSECDGKDRALCGKERL